MPAQWTIQDIAFMRMALEEAARQTGRTGDNLAAVGCVIVKDGGVVGLGSTSDGGRPHAEANALAQAGPNACGADVYVTLEPCAHISDRGRSCASVLIEASVKRVVACLEDPDPRTNGAGFARLQAAGIVCEVGLLADEGRDQVHALISSVTP
jgi:diaminohydroxyphosphoribosylaminopyrimidine deaminase / 5-amino-6-(5-phosphoribosylamino)uracil reductase